MKSNSIIVGRVNNHAMARSDIFNSFVLIAFSIASFIVFLHENKKQKKARLIIAVLVTPLLCRRGFSPTRSVQCTDKSAPTIKYTLLKRILNRGSIF